MPKIGGKDSIFNDIFENWISMCKGMKLEIFSCPFHKSIPYGLKISILGFEFQEEMKDCTSGYRLRNKTLCTQGIKTIGILKMKNLSIDGIILQNPK